MTWKKDYKDLQKQDYLIEENQFQLLKTYAVWLSKQDIETQNKVFGIEKSKIYRSELKNNNPTDVFRKFVRSDGSTLTLEELRQANAN